MLCLFLLGQSLHEFAYSQGHLLHGDITAADGLIEQQTETGNDGYEQQDEDDDEYAGQKPSTGLTLRLCTRLMPFH